MHTYIHTLSSQSRWLGANVLFAVISKQVKRIEYSRRVTHKDVYIYIKKLLQKPDSMISKNEPSE